MKHRIATGITVILAIAVWLLPVPVPVRSVLLLSTGVVFALVTAYGSYAIGAGWFLDSRLVTGSDAVAFTFDDGPEPEVTPVILDILQARDVKATFFLIGRKAQAHPGIVRRIMEEGHAIGNHSYGHSRMIGFFGSQKLLEDLEHCSQTLRQITGREVEMFRPPFGVTTPRYRKVLSRLNLSPVGWSLRSYDTVTEDPERLYRRITAGISPGKIVLLHDVPVTAGILPRLLDFCRQEHLKPEKLTMHRQL